MEDHHCRSIDKNNNNQEYNEVVTEEDPTTEHYESASLLRDSAKHGCHLCTLIWNSLAVGEEADADLGDWDNAKHECVSLRLGPRDPKKYNLKKRLHIQTDLAGSYGGTVYVTPSQRNTLPPSLTVSMTTISTRSAACASFYKRCLSICDTTHTRCHVRKVERQRLLPTRLLHVVGTGTALRVRLVAPGDEEGREFPTNTRFAALSYCWGEQRGFRLLGSNYKLLKADVPFSRLPGTIQDAIVVTAGLGLQYLWVDALCIGE